jgi:hypothetical protein
MVRQVGSTHPASDDSPIFPACIWVESASEIFMSEYGYRLYDRAVAPDENAADTVVPPDSEGFA